MGRRPIHDAAMTAAERQRRRRERLRTEPWRDQRRAVRAILQALRDLQGDSEPETRLSPELLTQIIDLVRTDAEARGCLAEVEAAREILKRGTSAHRQLAVYRAALTDGADERAALDAVVDWLIEETLNGVK